jgi:hypothetical protein
MVSNLGDSTLTGTLTLDDNRPATLQFPLPDGADYIFFKPDDSGRFVEIPGGYADTAPLVPGANSSQMMVSYLLPNPEQSSYAYTAPLDIKVISFLLPKAAGVTLSSDDLSEPQTTTLQDGAEYLVYSVENLPANQTITLAFSGQPKLGNTVENDSPTEAATLSRDLAVGGAFLGLAMILLGGWWWKSQQNDTMDEDIEEDTADANQIKLS